MRKITLQIVLFVLLLGNAFAAEQIVGFDAKDLPVLNEELRRIDKEISTVIPTGVIQIWTTDTAPDGWLLCYGQAVSRSTYAGLYNVIGETYGAGDSSTTFNVPDMRGRFPLGQDDMGGTSADRVTDTDADALAGADGDETKDVSFSGNTGSTTLTAAQSGVPAHDHSIRLSSGGSSTLNFAVNYTAAGNGDEQLGTNPIENNTAANASEGHLHTISGGSATQDIMPNFITMNYIIKF